MKIYKIFVYGTLCEGYRFHEDYVARFSPSDISKATVMGRLFWSGTPGMYPSLFLARPDECYAVHGNLITFPKKKMRRALKAMDLLERCALGELSLYDRSIVNVTTKDGETVRAFVYHNPRLFEMVSLIKAGLEIRDGSWTKAYDEHVRNREFHQVIMKIISKIGARTIAVAWDDDGPSIDWLTLEDAKKIEHLVPEAKMLVDLSLIHECDPEGWTKQDEHFKNGKLYETYERQLESPGSR